MKNNSYRISKSRYDSIDSYLSECGEKYNDIDLTKDEEIYEQLLQEGEPLSLFSRFDCKLLVRQSSFKLLLTPGLVSVFSVRSLHFSYETACS